MLWFLLILSFNVDSDVDNIDAVGIVIVPVVEDVDSEIVVDVVVILVVHITYRPL